MRRLCTLLILASLAGPAAAKDIVFSAPPRESAADGQATYGPIAEYLSGRLGRRVVYRHSRDWLSYIQHIQHDGYDLVFDGPHFVGYRMAKFGHVPLVRLPGSLDFVVIARRDNRQVVELKDLAGRPVCGHAPPNLATLTLQAQFPNLSRQPRILETRGFKNAFLGVIKRRCDAAPIPTRVYAKLDRGANGGQTRILYQSAPLPHQAFTAGRRVTPEEQEKIAAALLAPEAATPTERLRARFAGGKALLPARAEDYRGLYRLLRFVWGFEVE